MPPPLRLHLLEGQAHSPCQHGRCSSKGPASRHHRASPATSSPPASDGVLVFSRMASIWPGDRAAGSVSWSSPTMTTGPARLSCQPKDCARRLAASLTCFPADVPFSSSQPSHRVVTRVRAPLLDEPLGLLPDSQGVGKVREAPLRVGPQGQRIF